MQARTLSVWLKIQDVKLLEFLREHNVTAHGAVMKRLSPADSRRCIDVQSNFSKYQKL